MFGREFESRQLHKIKAFAIYLFAKAFLLYRILIPSAPEITEYSEYV